MKISLFIVILLPIIIFCTRPSTVNFIHMNVGNQVAFNPEGTKFGLGITINGMAIEIGGTISKKIDSLEIYKIKNDSVSLLWKIKSNNHFPPGFIEYGKTPKKFNQIYPESGSPSQIENNDIIQVIFAYKSKKDTLNAIYDKTSSTMVLKTKKK